MLCVLISIASLSDADDYTQHTLSIEIGKSPEIISDTIMSAAMECVVLGTQGV